MTKYDAVFVGFATLDISGRPVVALPEGGNIDFVDEIRINPAGTAVGAAMNAAKMGINTAMVSCLGKDTKSDLMMSEFAKLNINTSMVQFSDSTGTSTTILPIRPNGDRPCLHARGASDELFISDEQFDAVCDARFLHHGGTGFIRAMEDGQSAKLLEHAKKRGVTVSFDLLDTDDTTLGKLRKLMPFIDYFMPSIEEAAGLSGYEDPVDVAQFFLDLGAKTCVIKQGANGSFVMNADTKFQMPAYDVEVNDTCGCGDSYCGAFIAGLSMGYDLEEACRLGAAVSGLVASGLGSDAVVKDLPTTLEFMRTARVRTS